MEEGTESERLRQEVIRPAPPSPQVALLVPVQRSEPVVEAEQTGLRDYGREWGRVTHPRTHGTGTGTGLGC
jgi:hypothetical protein